MVQTPKWYLFDYGMVISTAPEDRDWDLLEDALGMPVRQDESPYWQHREDFDAGRLSSQEYWAKVAGTEVSEGTVSRLDSLDALQWSHLNLDTLDVLEDLSRQGHQLAVLSNMPVAMADEFSSQPWTQYFERLFFSGHLGLIKPNPEIFRRIAQELDASPEDIVFVDDKKVNVEAAAAEGYQTVHHRPDVDLQKELGL